jgi:hypothetical protein
MCRVRGNESGVRQDSAPDPGKEIDSERGGCSYRAPRMPYGSGAGQAMGEPVH